MALNLAGPEEHDLRARITVFGVGGAGGNAVNNMIEKRLEGVDFIAANTDAQALANSCAPRTIQMGTGVTRGLGAGSKPEVGERAAEETIEEIAAHLDGAHMCAPSRCAAISSIVSSAARSPTSGFEPAPRPRVTPVPIWIVRGAQELASACASVLAAMKSTPSSRFSIMLLTALPPAPPTPNTVMRARRSCSSGPARFSAIAHASRHFFVLLPRFGRFSLYFYGTGFFFCYQHLSAFLLNRHDFFLGFTKLA